MTKTTLDRRGFVKSAGAAAAIVGAGFNAQPASAIVVPDRRHNRIAVSTYSFWQFRNDELRDITRCIDLAAEMGFDGVEILHRQMQNESNDHLQNLKRRAFINGLDLCGFSTHQTFL